MTRVDIQRLYEQYGFLIHGRCVRILRDEDDARDAVHAVFLQLLQVHEKIREPGKVVAWIYRSAQNHCFNVLRSRKKFIDGADPDEFASVEMGADSQLSRAQIIRLALGCHSLKVQQAVYYSYVEELGQEEIRAITGQSPATIRRNLRHFEQSLPGLRKRLGL
jgi:RNA polymerase sigma-70 factor (ECF subfamily)